MSTWQRGIEAISHRRVIDVRPMLQEAFGRKLEPAAFVHGIFHTPGTQAAKIAELNGWIDSFIVDVHAHRVPENLQAGWATWSGQVAQWVEQWRAFVRDTDYIDRMWTDTADQIDRYEVRLCQLLAEFRTRWGGHSTMPAPPPCAASAPGSFWKTVGIGVLVSLTAAGVLYLIKRGFAPAAPTPVVLVAPPGAGVDDG